MRHTFLPVCSKPLDSSRSVIAMRPQTACVLALAVLFLASCLSLRTDPEGADAAPATDRSKASGGKTTGSGDGFGGAAGSAESVDAPPPAGGGGATGAENCGLGTHACSGKCVDDNSPATCGSSCEACPAVVGGISSCDGKACKAKCPAGQKACHSACVPESDGCADACPVNSHDCGGVCADNNKVGSCGTQCSACPAPPPGGLATCDGTKCDFTCEAGKRCGDKCGQCCVDADCPAEAGKSVTCDTATLKCKHDCGPGLTECNGQCIPTGACCKDSDCPMEAGKVGKCDASAHKCEYMCAADQKPCAGKCIANGGCCDDASCTGNFACVSSVCSAGTCRQGFKLCGNSCISNSGCCADTDCPGDFACSGHTCSNTTCRSGFKSCTGKCIASSGCCDDGQCTGNLACVGNVCSSTQCRMNYKRCGNECIQASMCCRADGCCGNADCGTCQKCAAGKCVPQGNAEDLKNECSDGTCRTGNCDGQGGCAVSPNNQPGPGCNTRETCEGNGIRRASFCQGGSCQTGKLDPCPSPSDGKATCGGSSCGFTCNDGFMKSTNGCVASCGTKQNEQCCANHKCSGKGIACDYRGSEVGTCVTCGIAGDGIVAPCCAGDVCNPGLFCIYNDANSPLFCGIDCGGFRRPCCRKDAKRDACDAGLYCFAGDYCLHPGDPP